MEVISNWLSRAVNYLSMMVISDFFDIVIVAYLVYRVIGFVRKTNSYNIAKGLLLILMILGLSGVFHLTMINFILRKTVELGLIALLVLFQPELRRLLERMGSGFTKSRGASGTVVDTAISQTVQACVDMAKSKTGALIIFERSVALGGIIASGTVINSDVSAELLKNIFFNKAPLHDGAVIIRDCRIAAAGCVLPLTRNTNLSKELGMRHRAGLGLSEESDALVIIVSEESGAISAAMDGRLKRHLDADTLSELLRAQLISDDNTDSKRGFFAYLKELLKVSNYDGEKQDEKDI